MPEAPVVESLNMTNFFNREMLLYALGDLRLPRPAPIRKIIYAIIAMFFWTVPWFYFAGVHINIYYFLLTLGPPVVLAHYATKNIFGGKTLVGFVKTMVRFLLEPRGWTNLKANNAMGREVFVTRSQIWISRRAEIEHLRRLRETQTDASPASKSTALQMKRRPALGA